MPNWKLLHDRLPGREQEENLHPVIRVLLETRGHLTAEAQEAFLSPDYERDVHDPFLFSQMERVVERLRQAKERDELVGIFGDFDADGVTSSVILREALERLGIRNRV
jgi:single-stranded-DNA-specific exonuclease